MACQYGNNLVSENGEQFIPASQRPDGTWRKARRVKEGYVPQEEVPLYESKGKQIMAKKQQSSIVLPTGQVAKRPIPGLFIIEDDTKTKKTPKKKSNQQTNSVTTVEEVNKLLEKTKITPKLPKSIEQPVKKTENNKTTTKIPAPSKTDTGSATATDPIKKLKNLKKRLREVVALEEKIKSGAVAKPEPDQIAKVNRKSDLEKQIKELEANM